MSDPAVCPNCAKMEGEVLAMCQGAYDQGVDDTLQGVMGSLEAMKIAGLSEVSIDDLIAGFKAGELGIRTRRESHE